MPSKRNASKPLLPRRRRVLIGQVLEQRQMMTVAPTTLGVVPDELVVRYDDYRTLTAQYADADGVSDIARMDFQVYDNRNGGRCFVRYEVADNVLELWSDETGDFATVGAPGSENAVSNEDCTINAAGTSVATVDDNTVEAAFQVSFGPTMDGTHLVHLRAYDEGGANSSTDVHGEVTVVDTVLGDLDGDGQVAFSDFLILSSNFGNDVESGTNGDLDGDGKVFFVDFLMLAENYGVVI